MAFEDEKIDGLEQYARKMKDGQQIERESNVDVLMEDLPIDDF